MQPALILLMTAALTAWLPDQPKAMDKCLGEASRFYPMYNVADPNDPSSHFIIECMAARGYDFTIAPSDCESRYPLVTQPACYTPNTWLGWAIDRVRRATKEH